MTPPIRLALIGLLAASTPALAADTYELDPEHTFVHFETSHLGVSRVMGRFNDPTGTFVLDLDEPAASKLSITIDATAVDSDNDKRDDHLRSPDFLNAKQFPQITFTSSKVAKKGGMLAVTGDLTLHGVTRSVTIPFEVIGEGDDPWGGYRKGAIGTFTFDRTDFGMDFMAGPVGTDVTIEVALEGVRQ